LAVFRTISTRLCGIKHQSCQVRTSRSSLKNPLLLREVLQESWKYLSKFWMGPLSTIVDEENFCGQNFHRKTNFSDSFVR
jgi:hypothetical protein